MGQEYIVSDVFPLLHHIGGHIMIGSPTIHDAKTDHSVQRPDLSIHKGLLSPLQLVVYNSRGDTWRWKAYFTSQQTFIK